MAILNMKRIEILGLQKDRKKIIDSSNATNRPSTPLWKS